MDVLDTVAAVRGTLSGKGTIAFVPTMGNLHAGHIALMERARALADTVVSSVFVNRLQFGPNEDFDRYPRTFAADCEQMAAAGVDFVFAPGEADLYPSPQVFSVALPPIENELEGAVRPGHFRGVATVVLKLFNIVQPQIAVFGQKDYQQLMIIRQMVEQFALPIEIVGEPTVRADDGLALSSRNGPKRRLAAFSTYCAMIRSRWSWSRMQAAKPLPSATMGAPTPTSCSLTLKTCLS